MPGNCCIGINSFFSYLILFSLCLLFSFFRFVIEKLFTQMKSEYNFNVMDHPDHVTKYL